MRLSITNWRGVIDHRFERVAGQSILTPMHGITPRLLIGNIEEAREGPPTISALLLVAEECDVSPPSWVKYAKVPLAEAAKTDAVALARAIAWIEQRITSHRELVRRRAGMGRSVSVAITYVCCVLGMSHAEAVALCRARHPGACPLPTWDRRFKRCRSSVRPGNPMPPVLPRPVRNLPVPLTRTDQGSDETVLGMSGSLAAPLVLCHHFSARLTLIRRQARISVCQSSPKQRSSLDRSGIGCWGRGSMTCGSDATTLFGRGLHPGSGIWGLSSMPWSGEARALCSSSARTGQFGIWSPNWG